MEYPTIRSLPEILLTALIGLFCPAFLPGQGTSTPVMAERPAGEFKLVQSLSDYVSVPSPSGEEQNAGLYLRELCRTHGLHIQQMGAGPGNFNFAASIFPLEEGRPNIIFLNHIDVVPAGDPTAWEYPPFSGQVTETELWGRGAFDNKGAAIMQLAGILKFFARYGHRPLPYNVTLLSVSCEETQCPLGVQFVLDNYLELLNPEVVIGEGPPGLDRVLRSRPETHVFGISVARKRALWLELELEVETAGHGSITPHRYASRELVASLHRLLRRKPKAQFTPLNVRLLKELGRNERGLTGVVLRHPRLFRPLILPRLRRQPEIFALFTNTLTLTGLDSHNEVVNVISGKASALLDCRLLPEAEEEKFLRWIRRKLKNDQIRIRVLHRMQPGKPSSPDHPFYRHLQEAIESEYPGSRTVSIVLPNFSDAGAFRTKGITAFSSIPVVLDRNHLQLVHGANERIPLSILPRGRDAYFDFLTRCQQIEEREVLSVKE